MVRLINKNLSSLLMCFSKVQSNGEHLSLLDSVITSFRTFIRKFAQLDQHSTSIYIETADSYILVFDFSTGFCNSAQLICL